MTPLSVTCCSYAIKKKDELERVAKVSLLSVHLLPMLYFEPCNGSCLKDTWRHSVDSAERC